MNIEAVTVCVGCDDFLEAVAAVNVPLFDRWLIVTTPTDDKTREVCRRRNLECLMTEDGRRGGGFKKGRMVERGLQHLSADGWRLHIDSDIALPHRFKSLLNAAELDEGFIYGIDRVMVRNWGEWQEVLRSGYLSGGQHEYYSVIFPWKLPMGARWAAPSTGWVPIGFFQLWHSSQDLWRGQRVKPYPMLHNDACRTDVQHALQWDRCKRALLPEVVGVHLASEDAKNGVNWDGRRTKRFGFPETMKIMAARPGGVS